MQKVVVIDYGGQYAHLLAKQIRRLGVYSEIVAHLDDVDQVEGLIGVVLSGGPHSVYEDAAPGLHPSVLTAGVPVLGICYGHQLLCHHLGGQVQPGTSNEYGAARLRVVDDHPLCADVDGSVMWMSHGDSVTQLPDGFVVLARTDNCPTAIVADVGRDLYGVQFHPEVTHSVGGDQLLEHFLYDSCGAQGGWDARACTDQISAAIREQVGDRHVFMLVSGGVDSSVAFALLTHALGTDRVRGLCIDTGLMRQSEITAVQQSFAALGWDNIAVHDASGFFLDALASVHEPEAKRHVIGETFLAVQQSVLATHDLDPAQWLLGQGTIYPDVIESKGTDNAHLIKTHHNRVPGIQVLLAQGLVVEPLASLYKDEVREVGRTLGLPNEMVDRHPFPGPGLGIRMICDTGTSGLSLDPAATGVLSDLVPADLSWQVLPFRSVGVQGDGRSYRHPLALWGRHTDRSALGEVATTLVNQCAAINRVVWWLGGTTPGASRSKALGIDEASVTLLQTADALVTAWLWQHDLMQQIWQMPVVLLPWGDDGYSIVLRPVVSTEAMTASFAQLDTTLLARLVEQLVAIDGIDAVYYDITHKPPGTIEWE